MPAEVAAKYEMGLTPDEFAGRMSRNRDKYEDWYQRFSWMNEEDKTYFTTARQDDLRCVVIAADWCGDVVRNVPVVLRVLEAAGIPVRLLVMEQHLDLIDHYLVMGGRSIPVVLFINTVGAVVGRWGPRPRDVQEVMERFKETFPQADVSGYDDALKAARSEMMTRYGEGTAYQGRIVQELRLLLQSLT